MPKRADRQTTCPRCGGPMSAGNGKGREPEQCLSCTHAARRAAVAPHGTNACYSRGCRRAECVEAHRLYMRDYMRNRRQLQSAGGAERA